MRHGDWLLTSVLAALAVGISLVTLGFLGFAFRLEWFLAGGPDCPQPRQIAAIIGAGSEFADIQERLAQVQAIGRKENERRSQFFRAPRSFGSRSPPPLPRSETQSLADEVKSLRSTLKGLSDRSARRAAHEPRFSSTSPASASPASPGDFSTDKLDLYLEPIVNLDGNSTTHYRASVELRAGDGRRVAAASLMAEAEPSGMRPALDRFAFERCARVGNRILGKRPNTQIFIPLGLATYGDPDELHSLSPCRMLTGRLRLRSSWNCPTRI